MVPSSSFGFLAAAAGGEPITRLISAQALVALVTLSVLEIVLGIDNIIFISVLADELPTEQQNKARLLGLSLAMVMRVGLLFAISWIMSLTAAIPGMGELLSPIMGDNQPLNWRDLILLLGGLFLVYKATTEIHDKLEGPDEHGGEAGAGAGAGEVKTGISFASVITQILILDLVFSLDSVITAVGMVQTAPEQRSAGLTIMVIAVTMGGGVMLWAARPIAGFVNRPPTVKMLAFAFLILVGVVLVVDASPRHIPKGYIYFAMAFSIVVETLNLKLRRKGKPVVLNEPHLPEKMA